MNIILIGSPRTGTRSFNLACTRTRWFCASAAAVLVTAIIGIGFLAGRGFSTVEGLSAGDVERLRQQLLV